MFHGLGIREFVQEHIRDDSDFWYEGSGNYYLISKLNRYTDADWIKLNEEVMSWDTDEREILALTLVDEDLFSQELSSIYTERWKLFAVIFVESGNVLSHELIEFAQILVEKDILSSVLKRDVMRKMNILLNENNQSE